jgi:hypothetical protein
MQPKVEEQLVAQAKADQAQAKRKKKNKGRKRAQWWAHKMRVIFGSEGSGARSSHEPAPPDEDC